MELKALEDSHRFMVRDTEDLSSLDDWHVARRDVPRTECGLPTGGLMEWTGLGVLMVACGTCRGAAGDARDARPWQTLHVENSDVIHVGRFYLKVECGYRAAIQTLGPACDPWKPRGLLTRPASGLATCLACLALERPS